MEKKLLLLDTNSIIHRAFHALPPLKDKKGKPSGAVYGSLLAFFSMITEFKPHYVVAVFDSPGKTFRHKEYKEYKAHRPKTADELISQIKRMPTVFCKMGVGFLAKEGLEADDIIGIISANVPDKIKTVIASGDGDVLQLVNEKTKVYTLKRGVKEGVLYDVEGVKKRYEGLLPEKLIDVKALQGDISDNIPGVKGIGEKTAVKIIKKYESIENLYHSLEENSEDVLSTKQQEILKKEKKEAFLSKKLATIKTENSLNFKISEFEFNHDQEKIKKIMEDMGFFTLAKRFDTKKEKKNLKLNL